MIERILKELLWKFIFLPYKMVTIKGFKGSFRSFSDDTKISKHVRIYSKTSLRNSSLGKYSYVSSNSKIMNAKIGNFCSIGQNVSIGGFGDHIRSFSTHPAFYSKHVTKNFYESKGFNHYKKVEIGHDVWIGNNVLILDGLKIGNGAIIGAGAVVTKDVLPYSIIGGVPAKVLKMRFDEQTILKLQNLNLWEKSDAFYHENGKYIAEENLEKLLNYHEE